MEYANRVDEVFKFDGVPTSCVRCRTENSADGYYETGNMRPGNKKCRIGICRKHKQHTGSTHMTTSTLTWKPITEPPATKHGWYAAAVLPEKHEHYNTRDINIWREQYGFTKVWYDKYSTEVWWEPDPYGNGIRPIDNRMTHWAELPKVPTILEDQ